MDPDTISVPKINASTLLLRAARDIVSLGGIDETTRQCLTVLGYTAVDIEHAVTHLRNQS